MLLHQTHLKIEINPYGYRRIAQQHLAEEEKLAKQQQETLRGNYKKYEIVDSVMADGTARRCSF
ncbi:RNA-binding family protein isoform 1 [Cucumis melo var. makuwa]|uniref:RNA-binding family protein isoform 1 n=1 Tax=Cucumis melo var. makuwa TaxID=1194695 RepID=A0A5A7UJ31_CUCMM|nr:RNA-binding family protein isoform 1 [Cucumis melo var. makuwa]